MKSTQIVPGMASRNLSVQTCIITSRPSQCYTPFTITRTRTTITSEDGNKKTETTSHKIKPAAPFLMKLELQHDRLLARSTWQHERHAFEARINLAVIKEAITVTTTAISRQQTSEIEITSKPVQLIQECIRIFNGNNTKGKRQYLRRNQTSTRKLATCIS